MGVSFVLRRKPLLSSNTDAEREAQLSHLMDRSDSSVSAMPG